MTNDVFLPALSFVFQSIPYERLLSGSNTPHLPLLFFLFMCTDTLIFHPCREDPANERPPSNDYSVKISMTNFLYFPPSLSLRPVPGPDQAAAAAHQRPVHPGCPHHRPAARASLPLHRVGSHQAGSRGGQLRGHHDCQGHT